MHPEFVDILQAIRFEYERPMIISSAYRSPKHSLEINKTQRGEHTYGLCADILVSGKHALDLVRIALDKRVERIGVHQKGPYKGRFVHLGIGNRYHKQFPAGIWTY